MDKITISKAEHERLTIRDILYSQAINLIKSDENAAAYIIMRKHEKYDKGEFKVE